jgi:hypothetical protein
MRFEEMNTKRLRSAVLGTSLVATLGLGVLAWGGRAPTMEERDNRKAVDAMLTAITMKNNRLLEESARRAQARRAADQLTEEQYQGMEAVIKKARARDWAGAEKDGYAFRKKHPFVKEGQ